MKPSVQGNKLPGTLPAALLCLLLAGSASAGGYYFTGYEYQVFWLGEPNNELYQLYGDQTTVDGVTRRSFDTGRRVSGLDPLPCNSSGEPEWFAPVGFARSAGAVDLASGSMALLAVTGGSYPLATAAGMLEDTLTFQLPDGMTEAEVTATLTINGNYTSPGGDAYHVSGYATICLGGYCADNGGDSPADSFVGQTFAITTTVLHGIPYPIRGWVHSSVDGVSDWCAGEIGSYLISAYVDVELPAGGSVRGGGLPFTSASNVFLTAEDSDSDGTADLADNCILFGNINQRDTNNDGIGNRCDADINNDCRVDLNDLAMFRSVFLSTPGNPLWNPDADLNGDNAVDLQDLAIVRQQFLLAPGPAANPNPSSGCLP